MTAPGEKPVIAEWTTRPTLGLKPVIMSGQTASAYLAGVRAAGGDGVLIPHDALRDLYRVKITKLAGLSADGAKRLGE